MFEHQKIEVDSIDNEEEIVPRLAEIQKKSIFTKFSNFLDFVDNLFHKLESFIVSLKSLNNVSNFSNFLSFLSSALITKVVIIFNTLVILVCITYLIFHLEGVSLAIFLSFISFAILITLLENNGNQRSRIKKRTSD